MKNQGAQHFAANQFCNKRNEQVKGTNSCHLKNNDVYTGNQNHFMSQSASRGQGKSSEGLYSEAVKGSSGKDKYFCPTQNTDYLSDQDIRNTGTNKLSGYNYTVPTSNRFNSFNQENY